MIDDTAVGDARQHPTIGLNGADGGETSLVGQELLHISKIGHLDTPFGDRSDARPTRQLASVVIVTLRQRARCQNRSAIDIVMTAPIATMHATTGHIAVYPAASMICPVMSGAEKTPT